MGLHVMESQGKMGVVTAIEAEGEYNLRIGFRGAEERQQARGTTSRHES